MKAEPVTGESRHSLGKPSPSARLVPGPPLTREQTEGGPGQWETPGPAGPADTHTPAPTKGRATCWMESGLCHPNSCVALGQSLSPSEFWFFYLNRSLEDTCLAGRV